MTAFSPRSPALFTPGPRFLAIFMLALPPAVVALSSGGITQQVSAASAISWFALVPAALYARWALAALPVAALASLAATVAVIPFNSAAFWANICTAAAMFLASLPRRGSATRELAHFG
jgi:uncharacterized membrane protein YqaE (UPF0057 family)